jgi:hypothetical protein
MWRELMAAARFDARFFPNVKTFLVVAGSLRTAGYRRAMPYIDVAVITASSRGGRCLPTLQGN